MFQDLPATYPNPQILKSFLTNLYNFIASIATYLRYILEILATLDTFQQQQQPGKYHLKDISS